MNKILIMLLFSCLGFVNAQNGPDNWERIPSPPGGWMILENVVKGDTVYAKCHDENYNKRLYRSIDAGLHWENIPVFFNNAQIAQDIYIGPSGRFYYLVKVSLQEKYLWMSDNEGVTWQLMNQNGLEFGSFVETKSGVLLRTTERLLGIDSVYIYRSTDHGSTWNKSLSIPYGVYTLSLIALDNSGSVVATRGGQLLPTSFMSNDDGLSWQTFQNPFTSNTYKVLSTYSGTLFTYFNALKRSTNGGQTWDAVVFNNLSTPYTPSVQSLLFSPDGKIIAIDRSNRLILGSDDEGSSWYIVAPFDQSFIGFGIDHPLNNGDILAYSGDAVYRSSDRGLSWQFSTDGVDHATIYQLELVNDSTQFVQTEYGIWRTTNGAHWTRIAEKGKSFNLGSAKNLTISTLDNKALYSTDWGDTFTEITPPNWEAHGNPIFISSGSPVLFANSANRNGLLRSSDQGITWTNVSSQIVATAIKPHPSNRYYAVTDSNGIWYSIDIGLTWTQLQNIPVGIVLDGIKGIEIGPNGSLLCMGIKVLNGSNVILRSSDNGAHWSVIETPAPAYFSHVQENALGHLYFVDNTSLYRSVDEGNSWQKMPDLYENPDWPLGRYHVLRFSPSQFLYAGTNSLGILKSRTSTDHGAYLAGAIAHDADGDCSTADAQVGRLKHWIVEARGQHSYFATTDSLGRYLMFIDTGHYEVIVKAPNQLWWDFCDSIQPVYLPELLGRDTVNFSAFAIADCPLITVNTAIPTMRRCFDNQVYIQYCNQGNEPADSAWVDVELDPYWTFVGTNQTHIDLGNNNIRFLVGHVSTGDCRQFQFIVNVDCDSTVLGQTHCVTAHGYPDTLCSTVPNWSGANIEAAVNCQDSTVTFELKNTGTSVSQILEYIIIEDDVVMFNGQMNYGPNQTFQINWPANGHTIRLESEQEPGHPFSYRVLAFEEGCGGFQSLGYINQFSVNGIAPSWHTSCAENVSSYDPNDKHGYPIGTGADHRIRPGQPIEYMIRFQNTGTDTAFTVVVRDSLAAELDPASIVPGVSSHPYTWQLNGQGEIKFTFTHILLPDSTTNLASSQGFVTFQIAQKPGLPLGTQIFNQAAIYFDFNAPILTNTTWHTLGLDLQSDTWEAPQTKKPALVEVSPNPATTFASFRLKSGDFNGHRIQVFDPLGRQVVDQVLSGNTFVMPRGNGYAGAYGWRVTDARGKMLDNGVVVFQ